MHKSLLYVHDGKYDYTLEKYITHKGMYLYQVNRKVSISMSSLLRHLHYFYLAALAITKRKYFDGIIIWQQYIAIYYCLLSYLFPFHYKPLVSAYVIFKRSKKSWLTILKRFFFLLAFNSRFVDKVIFFNKNDCIYSKLEKRLYIPFTKKKSEYIEKRIADIDSEASYFFSGGASNRDYSILEVLPMLKKIHIKIACLEKEKKDIHAPQIEYITNAYNDEFDDLILGCRAVIIPLLYPDVASGQIVILKALQAGKCIFISRNNFLEDWLPVEKTEDFIFTFTSSNELNELLCRFSSNELKERGIKARRYFLQNFSQEAFYSSLVSAILMSLT